MSQPRIAPQSLAGSSRAHLRTLAPSHLRTFGGVWYRHWLEIRTALWAILVLVLLMALFFPVAVAGITSYFEQTGKLAVQVAAFSDLLPTMTSDRLLPWGIHASFTTFLILVVPAVLFGSGFGSQATSFSAQPHPSVHFTLSLPVSRFELMWTRLAAGCAAAAVVLVLSLVAHCLGLLVLWRTVPLGPMALSSGLAAVAVLPGLAVFGMLSIVVKEAWAGVIAMLACWLLYYRGWDTATAFIASRTVPWGALAVVLVVAGIVFGCTALLVQRKEF